jgi:hypothetical protein
MWWWHRRPKIEDVDGFLHTGVRGYPPPLRGERPSWAADYTEELPPVPSHTRLTRGERHRLEVVAGNTDDGRRELPLLTRGAEHRAPKIGRRRHAR